MTTPLRFTLHFIPLCAAIIAVALVATLALAGCTTTPRARHSQVAPPVPAPPSAALPPPAVQGGGQGTREEGRALARREGLKGDVEPLLETYRKLGSSEEFIAGVREGARENDGKPSASSSRQIPPPEPAGAADWVTVGSYPASTSREVIERMVSYAEQNDVEAFKQLLSSGQVRILKPGLKVEVVEGAYFSGIMKIRPFDGKLELWTMSKGIQHPDASR